MTSRIHYPSDPVTPELVVEFIFSRPYFLKLMLCVRLLFPFIHLLYFEKPFGISVQNIFFLILS